MSSAHDRLFKATFSRIDEARSELSSVLPCALVDAVDWTTFELVSGEFVDPTLTQLSSDLLFTARVGATQACVYVLFEHQSTVDRKMPLRLLRYMTRVWERFADDKRGPLLPAIIPVVLHHSSAGWTAATRFGELLDVPAELQSTLADFVPDFTFVLDDLSKVDDDKLMARAMTGLGRLALLLLKRIREGSNPVELLQRWGEVLREVAAAPNGAQALSLVTRYIVEVGEVPSQELVTFFQSLDPKAEEVAVATVADQFRAEGREQGLAQGRAEAQAESEIRILLRLLARRFGPVSSETEQRVRDAAPAQRELWTDRLLTAATLGEVFDP